MGFIVPNFRGESSKHIWRMPRFPDFHPTYDSPPWIVLFCNHPSSACRRDMEPRSQQPTRFFLRLLGALKTTGCVQCARWDPSWPTAVVFHPPSDFPENFSRFLENFSPPFGENRSKIAFGREKNLTRSNHRTSEDEGGVQSPKAKIWGVPLPFSVSVSDRIGSLKILTPEQWRKILRTPKHPCVSYRFSHPKALEGSGYS